MKEDPWAVQPNRKKDGAGSKVISITFGFGIIYVACRRDLYLGHTALVLLVFLGEGEVLKFVYILGFLTAYMWF